MKQAPELPEQDFMFATQSANFVRSEAPSAAANAPVSTTALLSRWSSLGAGTNPVPVNAQATLDNVVCDGTR